MHLDEATLGALVILIGAIATAAVKIIQALRANTEATQVMTAHVVEVKRMMISDKVERNGQ